MPPTEPRPKLLFPLGHLVITTNARNSLEGLDVGMALARHQSGDWGDLSKFDKQQNKSALMHGSRILSVYSDRHGVKFWIITEADRSSTTVLLPEDY